MSRKILWPYLNQAEAFWLHSENIFWQVLRIILNIIRRHGEIQNAKRNKYKTGKIAIFCFFSTNKKDFPNIVKKREFSLGQETKYLGWI